MIALEDIEHWLAEQDERIQEHVATTLLRHVGFGPEIIASPEKPPIARLREWLNEPGPAPFRVGRIVTFRALVEFCFGARFAGDGWIQVEDLYSSMVNDHRMKGASRQKAREFLTALPALKMEWVRAGMAWDELVKASLSDVALGVAVTMEELERASTATLPLHVGEWGKALASHEMQGRAA